MRTIKFKVNTGDSTINYILFLNRLSTTKFRIRRELKRLEKRYNTSVTYELGRDFTPKEMKRLMSV